TGRHLSDGRVGSYDFEVLMKDAGLVKEDGKPKFTLHSLRHAAVSMLIDQGLEAFHLKKIIGHSRITTTMDTYGHLMPESVRSRNAVTAVGDQFQEMPLLAAPTRW